MDIRKNISELRKQLAQAIKEQRAGDVLARRDDNAVSVTGFEQREAR